VDGHRSSGNESSLLLRKGQPDPSTVVVVYQEVYADLRQASIARLPGGTAGALLGNVQAMGSQNWYTVRDAAALELEFTENGLAPEPGSFGRLLERMEGEHWQDMSVIGMFYADPEIGLFPARLDIGEIHRQLTPDASLLLLMNPSIDQGAFCLWREGMMLPVGGFYEALPEQSTSIIPWTGDWASMLIGAAGTLKRGPDTLRGRAGRTGQPEDGTRTGRPADEPAEDRERFDMRWSAPPESRVDLDEREEATEPAELPEESMASEAVERITLLARRLEGEGNLTGAVLLYRQALSLAPIIGDIALELRLRSTLHRLEEHVMLLEQDITAAATAAWADARERADRAQAAERAEKKAAAQASARQRTAVDELFDIGLAAFWKGDLLHARNLLAEVVRSDPTYRTSQHRAVNLLAGIERRLALPPPSGAHKAGTKHPSQAKKSAPSGRSMRGLAIVALPVVAVLVVLLFALSSFAPGAGPEANPAATPRVAQVLPSTSDEPIVDPAAIVGAYVAANGGAARFGQPVSQIIEEATDGITRTVRYYERGLLEYVEGQPSGQDVNVVKVGVMELARRYPQGAPPVTVPPGEHLFFDATGFGIAGSFRAFWEQTGNSVAFGQPVTGEFEEAGEGAGIMLVQYFEYGAMRRAPGAADAPVEAAPLGAERYLALYASP
jgi:hypothetical protein